MPEGQDGDAEQEMPRVSAGRPHRCPTKMRPTPGGGEGGSPPSLPEHALVEQIQMITSTASKSGGGCRC